ncbi:hypothetical protein EJ08DRAFT_738444 [Tothia fuscella]|uniref:Uncharacterized protein n=1 Tax=Tothia fuscella TaxID=1048955 RepID=A0A9P4TTA1_9PEZI|nr:hypothetical protein EJ08DRAFT_738444 [Tothia fuscella]
MIVNTPISVRALLSIFCTAIANPIEVNQRQTPSSTTISAARTLLVRAAASSYPYGDALPNEFQWRNWDPNDKSQKEDAQKIHNAFKDWQDLAKAGSSIASDTQGATFKRWMGKPLKPKEVAAVFANMWDSSAGTPTAKVAKMICDRDDFKKRCGASTNAYTEENGEFHICQFGLDKPTNSEIKCGDLDESCSAKMRSLSMTLLHEMTKGSEGIGDDAGGAYDCFKLKEDEKDLNAQNYAWFAGEAFLTNACSKTFEDPKVGVKTIGEDEAPPNSNGFHSPQCGNGSTIFHQEEADAAIVQFCNNQVQQNTVIVPLISLGSGKTADGRSKSIQKLQSFPVNKGASNLWMDISFATSMCNGNFQFDPMDCQTQLRTILNGCDTAGLFPKHGGWIQDSCAVYRMLAAPTADPNPLFLQANVPEMMGRLLCRETDTSGLGANSDLAGTCTCWYTGMPTVTEVFVQPFGGCGGIKVKQDPKRN